MASLVLTPLMSMLKDIDIEADKKTLSTDTKGDLFKELMQSILQNETDPKELESILKKAKDIPTEDGKELQNSIKGEVRLAI
ncbi:MAG: hypothetical protein L3J42_00085 [Hydrogenimonas sp.]|nr:hypothetical protein [Hydrogenimonas sp.]